MSVKNWQKFAKFMITPYVIKKCRAEYHYDQTISELKTPFLAIANHTTVFDAFLLSIGLDETIYYVTSDLYFRSSILGFLAKKAGCIPKAKLVSDIILIKSLLQYKKQNRSIGIYPEGYRIWDGQTDKLVPSTAKLIKLLKMPVMTAVTKGGYLSMPRWAKHHRRGIMTLDYKLILTEDQIQSLSVEQINEMITAELDQNDFVWQKNMKIKFRGKKPAETLELLLYCCPHCHSFETMKSKENRFYCCKCGYDVSYNEYGFFESNDKLYFDNVRDWRVFCDKELNKQLGSKKINDVFSERAVILLREKTKGRAFEKFEHGDMRLEEDGFSIYGNKTKQKFLFTEIRGLTISKKNMIDFYYDDVKYRIDPQSKTMSAVFWESGYKNLSARIKGSMDLTL